MKAPRLLALSIASLLLTPVASHAITDTWDGGSFASDSFSDGTNWADNTAPVSDLVNTDLIFAGFKRLRPVLGAAFSTNSITFNNTTGGFIIEGQPLNVGAGGITNNDAETMAFTNRVNFSGVANSNINAVVGGLTFQNTVTFPTNALTVTGGDPTSFDEIAGTSANELHKTGSGAMTWTQNAATAFDLTLDAGTLSLGSDGPVNVFTSTSAIAVNGTSTLNFQEHVTISGTLSRAIGAQVNLAAGKTLTLQNGGDAIITGAFSQETASTITVTGAGSTFLTTSTLSFGGGSTINVLAGGDVSASGGAVNIGTAGNAVMTVTGSGSSFGGGNLDIGLSGDSGQLIFSSGSTGTFGGIDVDVSAVAGTIGRLSIQTGATVTGTSLEISTQSAANEGIVSISGAGAMLTLNGAATANVGAASNSTGALNVNSGGTFRSGTGLTTVRPTGTIAITGTYQSRGNLTIDGGDLTRDPAGQLMLDAGRTLTVQAGGDATITGAFANTTASTITITGVGSTFTTTSDLSVNGGSALGILLGGDVSAGAGTLHIGTDPAGGGTVTVDGVGSSLNSAAAVVGLSGSVGSLTFTNGSTGTLSAIRVDDSATAGTSGLLSIQSGAVVTGVSLIVADNPSANAGTVTITGAGSALTFVGASPSTIGATSASTGALNVNGGATFNSGAGLTTVNATGTIAISGGTFNANGSLTLNGGQLTRDAAGVFALDATRTLTVQAGGDAIFTGAYTNSTASTIVVTGAGSSFSTTGLLNLGGGSATNVSAGGDVSAGVGSINVGTSGNGVVAITGLGSSLSGGVLAVAQTGNIGSVTFSNGSTGAFTGIVVDSSVSLGTSGTFNIQSGASVTGTGLTIAQNSVANSGAVTITGAGSALTLTGAATTTIGAASASSGTLTVANGGTFTTGTGLTTVNATGELNIDSGGTMIVRGNMVVKSALNIGDGGTVILGESAMPSLASGEFADIEGAVMISGTEFGGEHLWDTTKLQSTGTVVPEPGVVTLLLAGLTLLGFRQRK